MAINKVSPRESSHPDQLSSSRSNQHALVCPAPSVSWGNLMAEAFNPFETFGVTGELLLMQFTEADFSLTAQLNTINPELYVKHLLGFEKPF